MTKISSLAAKGAAGPVGVPGPIPSLYASQPSFQGPASNAWTTIPGLSGSFTVGANVRISATAFLMWAATPPNAADFRITINGVAGPAWGGAAAATGNLIPLAYESAPLAAGTYTVAVQYIDIGGSGDVTALGLLQATALQGATGPAGIAGPAGSGPQPSTATITGAGVAALDPTNTLTSVTVALGGNFPANAIGAGVRVTLSTRFASADGAAVIGIVIGTAAEPSAYFNGGSEPEGYLIDSNNPGTLPLTVGAGTSATLTTHGTLSWADDAQAPCGGGPIIVTITTSHGTISQITGAGLMTITAYGAVPGAAV